MALTDAEQAELDRLIAEKVKPEPRTDTGRVGVLHALIDSASGAVAHRSPEDWAALHKQAENSDAPADAPASASAEFGTEGAGFGAG